MNNLDFIKSTIFKKTLEEGIKSIPSDKKFVALHVSCAHMSVFCEYYDDLSSIGKEKGYELIEPQCYSSIKIVWDCEENTLLYCDLIGLTYDAFDYWRNNKDNPELKPKEIKPEPSKPVTEQILLNIATKYAKNGIN